MIRRTPCVGLAIRPIGSLMPFDTGPSDCNSWGYRMNDELAAIDEAISTICWPAQRNAIKAFLAKRARGVLIEETQDAARE